jgi:GAF domain-containing protein
MGAPRVHAFPSAGADNSRPAAARRCDILEASPAPEFDQIAALAADLLRAPAALVSLVDGGHRRWPLARVGVEAAEVAQVWPLCGHAPGAEGDLLVVNDAAADPRFADLPLVVGGQRIRFYAGAPIAAPDGGRALGTVCVLSPQPRPFGMAPAERRRLASLAAMAARA